MVRGEEGLRRSSGRAIRLCVGLATGLAVLALAVPLAIAAPGQFGEQGANAGAFHEPAGVAVSQESGDIILADRNNNRAERFGGEGEFQFAWGAGVADGVTLAPQKCTTVCFMGLEGSGSGEFNFPEGAAVDNDPLSPSFGDMYIDDQRNHRAQKFSVDGTFILMFGGEVNETADNTPGSTEQERNVCTAASGDVCKEGTPGAGNGQFEPTLGAIAVDDEGTVYVGDVDRVQKFNTNGEYVGQLTLSGAGSVTGLAVDAAKDVYVMSSAVAGVRKFSESGTEEGEARDPLGEADAITLGLAGELFVDDSLSAGSHHLLEYDPSGTQTASFDAGNEGGARGIAYGESLGVIYVVNASAVRLVSPPPPGPLVISQSTEAIEPTSATLKATVNPEGAEPTSYRFEYGTTTAYGEATSDENLTGGPFEDQAVSALVAGLQPRTTYHFRVVVSNGSQTTTGPDQTFTSLPPVLVDGESATQVSSSGAILGAELNPLGNATEYHFDFGLSASYGQSAPIPDASAGSGHDDVSVFLKLQGLQPNTVYHYRVVARNSLGVVEGEDHTFVTQAEKPTVLPDRRQWEMVSPPNKEGVSLESIAKEGAAIQASEHGSAITYVAKAAIEAESPSNRSLSNTQVLSKRGVGGWQSKDVSTPQETVTILLAGNLSEYKFFSDDLTSAVVQPQGTTPLSAQTSERTPYLRRNGEEGQFCLTNATCYRPLVTGCPALGNPCSPSVEEAANVAPGTEFGGIEEFGGRFVPNSSVEAVGASPDDSRIILSSPQNLTPGYEGTGGTNLFEWSGGTLRPVSVLPNGEAHGAAIGDGVATITRGAVSSEGDRVAFTVNHHPYLRDMTLGQTVQLDAPQGGASGAIAEFQGANRDASKVFFTSDARLIPGATAKTEQPDLYECEIGISGGELACALRDLTVDATAGQAANVQRTVSAISEDGRIVYFAANGVLAPGAQPGNCFEEIDGAICNLYMVDTVTGQRTLVGELSGKDAPDWNGHGSGLGTLTARTSRDGHYLVFMSERSLTGYDNRDASSRQRDEEVFLYDSTTTTTRCLSCDPSGARPEGIFDPDEFPGLLVDRPRTWASHWLAGSVPGWTLYNIFQAAHQPRYLSDSGRVFFNSPDALVSQDANHKEDVYQYEPGGVGDCAEVNGCINLISSGTSGEESTFLDADEDGSGAFFMTAAKLSEADVDSDFDVYDAHICSMESPCPPPATTAPPPCATSDSCRTAPPPQPSIFGPPPSATLKGSGNLAPPTPKPAAKPKPPTRAQLLAKALKACAKKPKKKRAGCRAAAHRRYGPKAKARKPAHRATKAAPKRAVGKSTATRGNR